MKFLITGCSGYVAGRLLSIMRDWYPTARIHGISRCQPNSTVLAMLDAHHEVDLCNPDDLQQTIRAILPDAVIHLASQRKGSLRELLSVNVIATESLLNALRDLVPNARIIVVGSSAEIGSCDSPNVLSGEKVVCNPVDAYGISKLAQSLLAQAFYIRYYQDIIRLRVFNILGPGLPDSLLAGRCARLLYSAGVTEKNTQLQFGDLRTGRDYTDVRDVARAILLAVEKASPGTFYHVGTGRATTGHEIVQMMIAASGMSTITYVGLEEHCMSVPAQAADTSLIRGDLGWSPEITLSESINDLWLSVARSCKDAL